MCTRDYTSSLHTTSPVIQALGLVRISNNQNTRCKFSFFSTDKEQEIFISYPFHLIVPDYLDLRG